MGTKYYTWKQRGIFVFAVVKGFLTAGITTTYTMTHTINIILTAAVWNTTRFAPRATSTRYASSHIAKKRCNLLSLTNKCQELTPLQERRRASQRVSNSSKQCTMYEHLIQADQTSGPGREEGRCSNSVRSKKDNINHLSLART